MKVALEQCSVDKNNFEIQIKQLGIDNVQILNQIMSLEIVNIDVNSVDIIGDSMLCVDSCNKCLELKAELVKMKNMIQKDVYNKLLKSDENVEKNYISLKLAMQLNQENFQTDRSCENQNDPALSEFCELNELKAQSQAKDAVIIKLKDRIKSLSEKSKVDKVKKDIDEIKTINIELKHSVEKSLSKNENLHKE
nr:hypothetical protein [Tanacetum cinerariifolium]